MEEIIIILMLPPLQFTSYKRENQNVSHYNGILFCIDLYIIYLVKYWLLQANLSQIHLSYMDFPSINYMSLHSTTAPLAQQAHLAHLTAAQQRAY